MGQTKQKKWTKDILKYLEAHGLHPVDVQYGNGYFIFEHGKDMVIHFHIKECKGWKFGIWWNLDGKKNFDFFTQFEQTIDKFKPAASLFVKENVPLDDLRLENIAVMCQFIKKHPYRAFKCDQTWTHDIWEWDLLNGCFADYWKQRFGDVLCPFLRERLAKKYYKIVKEIVDNRLINPKIIDEEKKGWCIIPRFHIICDGIKGEELKPGHYNIDFKEELDERLLKKIKRYNERYDKLTKINFWITEGMDFWGDRLMFTVKGKGEK